MEKGSNPLKEYDGLKQLNGLLIYRIHKQEQLLDRIASGKWKSEQVSEEVLYGLAKRDLELLQANKKSIDSGLENLRKQIHEDLLADI